MLNAQRITPSTHFSALAGNFIKKNRRGGADVERIHRWRHGDGDRLIAGFQHRGRDAVTFAAESQAAIAGEIRLGQRFFIGVRMRRNTADAAGVQFTESLRQSFGRTSYTSP